MDYERIELLEENIGYVFGDKSIALTALKHSSYVNEKKHIEQSNERLEFLGDSVLSLVVANKLFSEFERCPEGELTKKRAALVCEGALAEFAAEIKLGSFLYLGHGEEVTGGRTRPSITSDAFEALIAAIYLDGGMEPAERFILKFIEKKLNSKILDKDYKTLFQEVIQKNPEERIEYVLRGESGPDHDKRFTVELMLNSNVIASGEGRSKKQAEQMAARQALELMGE